MNQNTKLDEISATSESRGCAKHCSPAAVQTHAPVIDDTPFIATVIRYGCYPLIRGATVIFRRRLHGISEVSRTTFSDAN